MSQIFDLTDHHPYFGAVTGLGQKIGGDPAFEILRFPDIHYLSVRPQKLIYAGGVG